MVGPWPYRAFTFRALAKTYGPEKSEDA